MNTGFVTPGFPCMGAWISYGLGSLTDNLPSFVVIPDQRGLPYNNQGNFTSGFLPVAHQGTIIKTNALIPVADLFPPASAKFITKESEADGLVLLNKLNRDHLQEWQGDSRLEKRGSPLTNWPPRCSLSCTRSARHLGRKQTRRKNCTVSMKKPTEVFGRNCLSARRMLERGVPLRAGLEQCRGCEAVGQPYEYHNRTSGHCHFGR